MSTSYIHIVQNPDFTYSYFGDCTCQGTLLLTEQSAMILVTLTAANAQALINGFPITTSTGLGSWSVITPNIPGQEIGLGIIELTFLGSGGMVGFTVSATVNGAPVPIPDPTVINVDPPTSALVGDASARSQEELPANVHRAA